MECDRRNGGMKWAVRSAVRRIDPLFAGQQVQVPRGEDEDDQMNGERSEDEGHDETMHEGGTGTRW